MSAREHGALSPLELPLGAQTTINVVAEAANQAELNVLYIQPADN